MELEQIDQEEKKKVMKVDTKNEIKLEKLILEDKNQGKKVVLILF